MFNRRHPYLYFILIFSSIAAFSVIILTSLVMIGSKKNKFEFGEKVGIIEVTGYIAEVGPILDGLKTFRRDDTVKAVVIRIDSPGGGVAASQEIYQEILKTKKVKKVVASMGTIAASGGYYIAAAADGIIASPGTITGSIGVIMGFTNFESLLKKIGLFPVVIKSGEYKDTGSPHRQMTAKEKLLLQEFVDQIHKQFVNAIAQGRNMEIARIEAVADGRILSGETALSLGFVDRMGNFEDAVEWAGELGGIKGKVSTVYAQDKKFSFLRYLIDSSIKMFLRRSIMPTYYGGYVHVPSG